MKEGVQADSHARERARRPREALNRRRARERRRVVNVGEDKSGFHRYARVRHRLLSKNLRTFINSNYLDSKAQRK